jgi:hypothetical protein
MIKNSEILIENPEILEKMLELNDDELFYNKKVCPICGSDELFVEGRCTTCIDCGWSKCSI